MPTPNQVKLAVATVIADAFSIIASHRHSFTQALAVPLVCLVAVSVAWRTFDAETTRTSELALWGIYAAIFVMIAVRCHRAVLLETPEPQSVLPRWSMRETRFAVWMFLVWIAAAIVFMSFAQVVAFLAMNLMGSFNNSKPPDMELIEYGARFAYWYVFARMSPIFPATALDQSIAIQEVWRLTRGNGLRLFVVVSVLPFCTSEFVSFLYRDEPSLLEMILLHVLAGILLVVEVAALSLSYRALTAGHVKAETGP